MRTFPDVPTVTEVGYEGFQAVNWTGLVAPARTPAAIVARLNEEIRKAHRQDDVLARLAAEGSEHMGADAGHGRTTLAPAGHRRCGR